MRGRLLAGANVAIDPALPGQATGPGPDPAGGAGPPILPSNRFRPAKKGRQRDLNGNLLPLQIDGLSLDAIDCPQEPLSGNRLLRKAMPKQHITEEAAPAELVEAVRDLGARIRLARQRRRLRQADLAARAGITTRTLRRIESGELGSGVGGYAAVLWAMGLLTDLAAVADPDTDAEGRTLEAARRGERVRRGAGLDDDF